MGRKVRERRTEHGERRGYGYGYADRRANGNVEVGLSEKEKKKFKMKEALLVPTTTCHVIPYHTMPYHNIIYLLSTFYRAVIPLPPSFPPFLSWLLDWGSR